LLIINATILTFDIKNPILFDSTIRIKNGFIVEIGKNLEPKYPDEEILDAHGMIVFPGMIIPHFHIYGTLARGIPLKGKPPQNFMEILQKLWWRLDKNLTEDDIRFSAYVALIDCIKSGTTTLFDHHASPNATDGSLDILAEVFDELGLRGCLSYEVSDRDGEKIAQAGIEENIRFSNLCCQNPNGMLAAKFGLHASFTLSDQTLETCKEVVKDLDSGFHLHLGEGKTDRYETQEKYGAGSPVKRLEKFGILNNKTIVAHGIDVKKEELDIFKVLGVTVIHNPQSNMNNGVGFSDVEKMMEMDLLVGLGTDGMTTNIFKEIQAAVILQKHQGKNPSAGGNSILKIVTENHKKIASQTFNVGLGEIKQGNCADLIFIKYDPPTPLNEENYWFHLLYGFGNFPAEHTMVSGKFLMKNREVLVCDEEKIMREARKYSKKLWDRFL
jgi:putative selenium metabolism protein SsnA